MCDFSVITQFGFCSLCDNRIKSRSVPFHFGWRILPCYPWGEEVPWLCMGEAAAHGAKRPHAREVLFDALTLCCPWGERKTLRVWVRLLSMELRACIPKDNIMPIVDGWIPWPVYVVVWYLCDKLPYVRFHGFGNYIVGAYRI